MTNRSRTMARRGGTRRRRRRALPPVTPAGLPRHAPPVMTTIISPVVPVVPARGTMRRSRAVRRTATLTGRWPCPRAGGPAARRMRSGRRREPGGGWRRARWVASRRPSRVRSRTAGSALGTAARASGGRAKAEVRAAADGRGRAAAIRAGRCRARRRRRTTGGPPLRVPTTMRRHGRRGPGRPPGPRCRRRRARRRARRPFLRPARRIRARAVRWRRPVRRAVTGCGSSGRPPGGSPGA